ncbi:MAG: hypothetical protein EBT46_04425 [Actinobacteria bacterium]|nr:hypothetical protein [Actinomycetota bacterium]
MKGTIAHDRFGLLAIIAVCFTVVMSAMTTSDAASHDSLDTRSKSASRDSLEPYALMLTAALGAAVMVSANDLLAVFLGIEILSLSLYVLAASDRRRTASQEAGLKYALRHRSRLRQDRSDEFRWHLHGACRRGFPAA